MTLQWTCPTILLAGMQRRTFSLIASLAFSLSLPLMAQTTAGKSETVQTFTPEQHRSVARTPYEAIFLPRLQDFLKQTPGIKLSTKADVVPLNQSLTSPQFGFFSGAPFWNTGTGQSAALVTGDFNHDGKADIANIQIDGEVDVLLNDGSGNFGTPVITPVPTLPSLNDFLIGSATAVDLNGDGFADLVLTVSQSSSRFPILLVMLNQKMASSGRRRSWVFQTPTPQFWSRHFHSPWEAQALQATRISSPQS